LAKKPIACYINGSPKEARVRIIVTFTSESDIELPVHYNYLIQSLIYKHLDKKLARKLHDKGFFFEKRNFKLFCFSRLQGKPKFSKETKRLVYKPPVNLVITSPLNFFIQSLAENLIKVAQIKIDTQELIVESIEVISWPDHHQQTEIETTIHMLSPITIYSSLTTTDGKKKTYYYSPTEKDFTTLIKANLIKKFQAFGKKATNLNFKIEPKGFLSKNNEKIINYKGTVIKGWMGQYKLTGSSGLIKFAYDTGLGAKNSQGFGCFEIAGGYDRRNS